MEINSYFIAAATIQFLINLYLIIKVNSVKPGPPGPEGPVGAMGMVGERGKDCECKCNSDG